MKKSKELSFNKYLEELKELFEQKNREYSSDDDLLYNFTKAADISGLTGPEVCHGYLMKHFVSYLLLIEKVKDGKDKLSEHRIDEKMKDLAVYFIIQRELLHRYNNKF